MWGYSVWVFILLPQVILGTVDPLKALSLVIRFSYLWASVGKGIEDEAVWLDTCDVALSSTFLGETVKVLWCRLF